MKTKTPRKIKTSGRAPRKRGDSAEYRFRDWLISQGIAAFRQPLSGSCENAPGDLVLRGAFQLEVKYRRTGFPFLQKSLGTNGALALMAPRQETLVVMRAPAWAAMMNLALKEEEERNHG